MDGIEAGWGVPLLLVGFVGVWFVYMAVAYSNGDLHSDVLEAWTLGRTWDWGNAKHPPLMGWVARAWTTVFPLTNWSLNLMALTNAAVGLWFVDLISRRFVHGDKRFIVLLLLMLMPIYQFHAQRFNANSVLLAPWPLATYCFLRSFETREFKWAAAAGAAAALAMLGKYYSVFLLAGFFFAAMVHPQRRVYFSSRAPWVSMAAGLVALAPHLYWLATTGAQPCAYAVDRHLGKLLDASLIEAVVFVAGAGMLLAWPAAIWALLARSRLLNFVRDFRALNSGLWLLFLLGIATIVFPAVTAVLLRSSMMVIWSVQGLFLFVILLVCGASYQIERDRIAGLAAFTVGAALLCAVIVAPAHALYRNTHPLHEGRNYYGQVAEELTRQWHTQVGTPLRVVGGDDALAFALAFYSADHPIYERRLVTPLPRPWPRKSNVETGWAALCFSRDEYCAMAMQKVAERASRIIRSEIVVQSSLWGQPGAGDRFVAFIVPPLSAAPPSDTAPAQQNPVDLPRISARDAAPTPDGAERHWIASVEGPSFHLKSLDRFRRMWWGDLKWAVEGKFRLMR
jgi:4-amino-4-deoxy-L-arabinose transferase-like glycosyltransferase